MELGPKPIFPYMKCLRVRSIGVYYTKPTLMASGIDSLSSSSSFPRSTLNLFAEKTLPKAPEPIYLPTLYKSSPISKPRNHYARMQNPACKCMGCLC